MCNKEFRPVQKLEQLICTQTLEELGTPQLAEIF